MCEQCLTGALVWHDVMPGWALIKAQHKGHMMEVGDWGLVQCNDPAVVFPDTPIPNALDDLTDDEVDALGSSSPLKEQDDKFLDALGRFREELMLPPEVGYDLVEAAKQVGYTDESGAFDWWLFDYLGRYLANHPTPDEDVSKVNGWPVIAENTSFSADEG